MRITELVQKLLAALVEHGDVPVFFQLPDGTQIQITHAGMDIVRGVEPK